MNCTKLACARTFLLLCRMGAIRGNSLAWLIKSTGYCICTGQYRTTSNCGKLHQNLHMTLQGTVASQITSLTIVYSAAYSDADQRKHHSSASMAFVRVIHRSPVNSPHKWPVTRKCFHLMTSSWIVRALFSCDYIIKWESHQIPLSLTWIHFNPSMAK